MKDETKPLSIADLEPLELMLLEAIVWQSTRGKLSEIRVTYHPRPVQVDIGFESPPPTAHGQSLIEFQRALLADIAKGFGIPGELLKVPVNGNLF